MADTEDLKATWDRQSIPHAAAAVVKRIEGFSATPYDDNGAKPGGTWTIGYGTIVDADGKRVTPNTPRMTEAAAEELLLRDMQDSGRSVATLVQPKITIAQAAALISWTYNLGAGNLRSSTMLKRINAGAFADVPGQMKLWINQEGKPVLGLLRRRWAEAAIFQGIDPTNAVVLAWREIDSLDDWPTFN
jgi:lysozyme